MTFQNRDGRSVVAAMQNAACFSAAHPVGRIGQR